MSPLDLVPGWGWAGLVAALGIAAGVQTVRLDDEQADHAQTVAGFANERAAAATELAKQTGLVLTLERTLATTLANQEKTDAENKTTVAGLTNQLRTERARTGGRMLDPNATACPAAGAAVAAGSGPDSGAADPAQTGGLLSVQLTQLLDGLMREADDVNAAYISCRSDALTLRATAPP